MAAINLRRDKERPLTIEEVDNNFDNINREVGTKFDSSAFTAPNILTVLDGKAGAGSTLDADKVQGKFPSSNAYANTVVIRDSTGNIYAVQFYGLHVGNVVGNLVGNVTGTLTGNATNVDGTVQIDHGGTGAVTASGARTNLGLGNMAVQNKNTVDITGGDIVGITDLAIADGGTGASNATGARSNLGLVIGADIQAYAAVLAGISGTTGNGFLARSSTNAAAAREIKPGNSIEISNGTGANGDPTIGLSLTPSLTSITKTGTAGSGDIGQLANRFGNAFFNGVGVGDIANAPTGGELWAKGNVVAYYSDDNLKTRLGNIEGALDKIDQLTGFYYEANETAQELGYEKVREVGLSAQDTQKIMPEIVSPAPVDNKYLTIKYDRFAPLLVEGIKELRREIEGIKKHIGMN